MKILGIDPGYERLGIAITEGVRGKEILVHSECFKTSSKLDFEERILLIGNYLEKIIKKYKPELLSIENLFITKNQKTGMRVSEVRGAILYIAKNLKLKIVEYSPLEVKSAITGYGRSDKSHMEKMLPLLIKIDERKKRNIIDDEFDAIALALTASANIR